MFAHEYIDFAIKSEIKSLAIANIGSDDISDVQEANREELISHLNLANIEIHKKFSLITKELLLEDFEPNKVYDLPTDFLYGTFAAFQDGIPVVLNNERVVRNRLTGLDSEVSLMFPSPFTALTKGTRGVDTEGDVISLLYISAPPVVTKMTDFIDLSHVFTEALLYYMAFKAFSGVSGDIQATNNTFYLRFIESCKNVVYSGLTTADNLDTNNKLNDSGFV